MKKQYKILELDFMVFEKDIVCASEIIVDGDGFYGGDEGWEEGT